MLVKNLLELRHGSQPRLNDEGVAIETKIDFDEFLDTYYQLCVRQEIFFLVDAYASLGCSHLTATELQTFLQIEQEVRL